MNARTARFLREYSEATHSDYKKLKRGWPSLPHQAKKAMKEKMRSMMRLEFNGFSRAQKPYRRD